MTRSGSAREACGPEASDGVNPVVAAFAARMSEWRKGNRKTLKEVAMDIGVSISIVSEWEHGHRFPSVAHLLAISRLAHLPPPCLICAVPSPCQKRRRSRLMGTPEPSGVAS